MAVSGLVNTNLMATGSENAAPTAGTDRMASDKQTFLKLLVAQLTNQDPLNPTEDKEFVAQLAQFTSLEQLQAINAGVEGLNTTMNQSQLMTATGFIGKDVVAKGDQITKTVVSGQVVTTSSWFTLDGDAAKVQATVLDEAGNPVFSEEIGGYQKGTWQYPGWDGKTAAGTEAPNGIYTLMITAQDKEDKAVIVSQQQLTARVMGVVNESGVYKLVLDGGREVNLMDVTEITQPDEASGEADTYSGVASDLAAKASLAKDSAERYAANALASAEAVDAKQYALAAVEAARSANTAAKDARTLTTKLYGEVEKVQTNEALEEYDKTNEQAKRAEGYAGQATESANNAVAHAKACGASFTTEEESTAPREAE